MSNETIESAEVENGWLSLELDKNTKRYYLIIEYYDGIIVELKNYKKYSTALKRFYEEAEKLQ